VEGLGDVHWLARAAVRAGLTADPIDVPATTAVREAWSRVADRTGLDEHSLARAVAAHFGLHAAVLESADARAIRLLPRDLAMRFRVFPLREDDHTLVLASADPTRLDAEEEIGFAAGRTPVFEVAPPASIDALIDAHYANIRVVTQRAAGSRGVQACVLLVDDDATSRRLARSLLEHAGHCVTEAADGDVALEMLRSGAACCLIVLDLTMPRMDGRQVLEAVRASAATAALPVVVLTGAEDQATEIELLDAGADDYIRKPIDPARFIARVRAALRRAGRVDEEPQEQ